MTLTVHLPEDLARLLSARALQGIGAAALSPASLAIRAKEVFP